MKVNFTTLMLAAAALLASCSNDDALQVTNDNDGLKAVTVTATLPEGSMITRAAGGTDATVARCYVQVLDANGETLGDEFSLVKEMTAQSTGGFTTTVYLNEGETYTFLFWADSDNSNAPNDLKAVTYTNNGATIAWAGKMEEQTWSEEGISCTLSHVVARITVHSSTAVELSGENNFTVAVPTTYTTYNVYSGAVSNSESNYTYTDGTSSCSEDGDLCHFYVLVGANESNQTLTLQYNGVLGNPEVNVDNVPLKANWHTTLSGDVYNLGLVNATITTTISTEWTDENRDF